MSRQILLTHVSRNQLAVVEDLGNPWEEMSQEMIVSVIPKQLQTQLYVKTVRTAKHIGQEKFNAFAKNV